MPKIGTLDFTGISGHKYTFNVYPKNREHKEKEAVYVVTHRTIKADAAVDHLVIFVGESTNLRKEFTKHPKDACFEREVANCICVVLGRPPGDRTKIADDLRNFYHPPCNDF
ncbi:MAG: hypothetical protein U5K79_02350 [Cyclobacteriaceae bacterium]|nr:hypothetical protein [Cyclobacteriaceae bacterium]